MDGSAAPVYLIDRQPFSWSLTSWLAVSDLTYWIVTWWPTAIREELEEPVLRHYHAALAAAGVSDYSWPQLVADYRLCSWQSVLVAIEWCALPEDRERMRWVWWPELQRALAAVVPPGDLMAGAAS